MIKIRREMKLPAIALVCVATAGAMQTAFAQRSVADDTLTGAAKGAVIGAIAGDAGKGAAAGAVGGALFGGMTKQPGHGTTASEDLVGGAVKGAVIGGIAGDAGKGAAAGAAGSLLFGEIRRNRRLQSRFSGAAADFASS